MNRTVNRLFLRLAMLCIAIILGAVAVSQAQKGLAASGDDATQTEMATSAASPTNLIPTQSYPATETAVANTETQAQAAVGGFSAPAYPDDTTTDGAYRGADEGTYDTTYAAAQDSAYDNNEPDLSGFSSPTNDPPREMAAYDQATNDASAYDPGPYAPPMEAANDLPPTHDAMAALPSTPSHEYPSAPADTSYDAAFDAAPVDDESYAEVALAAPAQGASEDYAVPTQYVEADPVPAMVAPPQAATTDDAFAAPATELPPIDDLPAEPALDLPPQPSGSAFRQDGFESLPPEAEELDSSYAAPTSDAYTGSASVQITRREFAQSQEFPQDNAAVPTNALPPTTFPTQPQTPRMAAINNNPRHAHNIAGSGKPGPSELEGPQTPTLTVSKSAPDEIQVGKPAKFQVVLRNVGPVDANDVMILDEVPEGTQLVKTVPQAQQSADGKLIWEMGTVRSGAEVSVTMEVIPMVEGEIGSIARVSFNAAASARATATKPQLLLEHTGPGQVLIGQDVIFHIRLSNPGTGVATNVRLEEDVPGGLRHIDGTELEYLVGTIRPGETRLLELTLKADQEGPVENILYARADSDLVVEDRCPVTIIAPSLQVGITGPNKRYLDRKATFQIQVANPGSAPSHNVRLAARLPKGLSFVSTNNAGQYNATDHTVYWSLAELPAGEMGVVEVVANAVGMGEQRIRVESSADMGLAESADHGILVEGLAALLFTCTDVADPIEIEGQTTYEIKVQNQGSKAATNLVVLAAIPPGMQAINGEGPTRVMIEGQKLQFEPLPRLAPQADAIYKIFARGLTPGDKRLRVQLFSDELREPITSEESTHVYSDE